MKFRRFLRATVSRLYFIRHCTCQGTCSMRNGGSYGDSPINSGCMIRERIASTGKVRPSTGMIRIMPSIRKCGGYAFSLSALHKSRAGDSTVPYYILQKRGSADEWFCASDPAYWVDIRVSSYNSKRVATLDLCPLSP